MLKRIQRYYELVRYTVLVSLIAVIIMCVGCSGDIVADIVGENNTNTIVESNVPQYEGEAYKVVNDNVPEFTDSELKTVSFESYGELDELGRCTVAKANIGKDLMPTEERGAIGRIKPTGWHTVKYDCVDGKYLYNRCHLIGFQLTGENDNEKNLITGTRYMNVDGMLPFEDMVADYIKETGNHVMYRVTPVYEGDNLVATGVQMEAKSVEDKGEGICFNVFVYNIQPGVKIDYLTGESTLSDDFDKDVQNVSLNNKKDQLDTTKNSNETKDNNASKDNSETKETYILNTNGKKYHKQSCASVSKMSEKNKQTYTGTKEELEKQGYTACKNCHK